MIGVGSISTRRGRRSLPLGIPQDSSVIEATETSSKIMFSQRRKRFRCGKLGTVMFCGLIHVCAWQLLSSSHGHIAPLLDIDTSIFQMLEGGSTPDGNKITLVTGFWAQPESQTSHPHRKEIEAALLANLKNPIIDQVLVVLDSITENANCQHFVERMNRLQAEEHSETNTALLTCIEHRGSQPTYLEMFQYTLHPKVEGNIVMLSNTDQVFDETLLMARNIPPKTIYALSTSGYHTSIVPQHVQQLYHSYVGAPLEESTTDRCRSLTSKHWMDIGNFSLSWDTYIFHQRTIRQSMWKVKHFKRRSFKKNIYFFYMNEMGAENAALHDIVEGLQSSDVTIWNPCKLIHSWHFHLTPKTHRNDTLIWPPWNGNRLMYYDRSHPDLYEASEFVPPPRFTPPLCSTKEECLRHQPRNGAHFQTQNLSRTFL